jgi:ABC-type sulfate transport system permease component
MIFAGIIPWKTEVIPTLVFNIAQTEPNTAIAAAVLAETLSIVALISLRRGVKERR